MTRPTDEEIKEAAEDYRCGNFDICGEDLGSYDGFTTGARWALEQSRNACQLDWKRPEEEPDDKRMSIKTPIIMLFLILGHLEWSITIAENLMDFDMQTDMDDDRKFMAWAYWCGPEWVK